MRSFRPSLAQALGLATLLSAPLLAHDGPDPMAWKAEGAAHFRQGILENLKVVEQDPRLVIDQTVPGVFLPHGTFVSPFYSAPVPFNAVQVGFGVDLPDSSELEVQVRALGGDQTQKTRWYRVEPETEVQFDGFYRYLQYRVGLYTSNPESTPAFRFFFAQLAVVPRDRGPEAPGTGNGDVPKPTVIARASWGAKPPKSPYSRHTVQDLVVHHSSAPNASQFNGASSIRGIQAFHQNERGWIDIGYHFLIGPDGKIWEGRPTDVSGAHVIPNPGKVGVCMIGDFQGVDVPTPEARESLKALLAWLSATYGVAPIQRIFGHRDWMSTNCPGDTLYGDLPSIRQAVKDLIDGPASGRGFLR